MLLLRFPGLKQETGPVLEALLATKASLEVLAVWKELVAQELLPEQDEEF